VSVRVSVQADGFRRRRCRESVPTYGSSPDSGILPEISSH